MSARKAGLGFIFVTLFLDILGLGLVVPVLPRLVGSFHADDAAGHRSYGLFVACYAAMQFLFSPLIGSLSDRYGRRPLLLVSALGQGLDYLVLGLAGNLPLLFVARMVSGVTGASIGTAAAYIADVSPPERRARNFGLIGVAFGLGFVAGPALGGVLGAMNLRLPFFAAAAMGLANFAFGLFVLPESLAPEHRRAFDWRRANPLGSVAALRRYPSVLGIVAALVLAQMAQRGLESVWILYTSGRYGWDVRATGSSLAAVGIAAALVQGGVVRRLLPRLGERRSMLLGLSLSAVGLTLYGLAPEGWMLLSALPVGAMGGIAGPAGQGLLSRQVGADEQGLLQGAVTSLQSLTSVFAPLYATHLFAAFGQRGVTPYVPGAPFFAGALIVLAALAIAARTLGRVPEGAVAAAEA
jgi:DHA1 family tetracycline resistance protein-like MFS transporter